MTAMVKLQLQCFNFNSISVDIDDQISEIKKEYSSITNIIQRDEHDRRKNRIGEIRHTKIDGWWSSMVTNIINLDK